MSVYSQYACETAISLNPETFAMPRRKPKNAQKTVQPRNNINVLQQNKSADNTANINVNHHVTTDLPLDAKLASCDINKDNQPDIIDANRNPETTALYDELESFRHRWKREIATSKTGESAEAIAGGSTCKPDQLSGTSEPESTEARYARAKKLFLTAVQLEQDEMQYESIRYYKEAMHLCPDIEKQIFREQCEASAQEASSKKLQNDFSSRTQTQSLLKDLRLDGRSGDEDEQRSLLERLEEQIILSNQRDGRTTLCRPRNKIKPNTVHVSELPHDLIIQIFRYVVGRELDLASLEILGLVCRGFFVLSRDNSLWQRICQATWGSDVTEGLLRAHHETRDVDKENDELCRKSEPLDWRQLYMKKPRPNFDGIYMSKTRYVRQGDAGFQDLTYRPFHVIRYYRYIRFFPDKRVLILTTNEEPEKIVPIFRHALFAKQFSPELSILEGTYDFDDKNQMTIVAEKDCLAPIHHRQCGIMSRRQAQMYWSRQTPIAQQFTMKFELKTVEHKPYTNNVLKWLDYTIVTTLETGQEVTRFDLAPDTFPSLAYCRVRRFNLRSLNPLDF